MLQHDDSHVNAIQARQGHALTIPTPDGEADAALFKPTSTGPWPAVILYMDAFGLRPALYDMARRLADQGYCVLVPNLFYRNGALPAFDPATAFSEPASRDQLLGLIGGLSKDQAMADTRAWLDTLATDANADTGRVGTVGYCMGGGLALLAMASYAGQVLAAATFHGGYLVTDKADSPHLRASELKGRVYIAAAENDASFSPADGETLRAAFDAAAVPYTLEFYPARHGFAIPDTPAHDPAVAEKHWQSLLDLFRQSL